MRQTTDRFTNGQMVTVTQQIPQGDQVWATRVTGKIVAFRQKKTGSWFAHAKDAKLWLDRLRIEKQDGELVEMNLDQYTRVETIDIDLAEESSSPSPLAEK